MKTIRFHKQSHKQGVGRKFHWVDPISMVATPFELRYDLSKGADMNIFEAKEAKIKSYLKYLNKCGATTRAKAAKIEDVERALKVEDRLFDEITKYLIAEGSIRRSAGVVYITKTGVAKL